MAVKLTDKQRRFVEEYCSNGFNATQAAISAGYSEKTAKEMGCENLSKPNIQIHIQEFMGKAKEKAMCTIEKRLAWLEEIVEAGLYSHKDDAQKLIKRENLNASVAAIKTLNEMLGTGSDDETGETLNINFTVSEAVKDVKVTNAKT